MFDKNPAYALNIPDDSDVQVRLCVKEEFAADGVTSLKEIEKFSYCVNAAVYRVQSNRWPPASGSI
jgi:hypothetical protein